MIDSHANESISKKLGEVWSSNNMLNDTLTVAEQSEMSDVTEQYCNEYIALCDAL